MGFRLLGVEGRAWTKRLKGVGLRGRERNVKRRARRLKRTQNRSKGAYRTSGMPPRRSLSISASCAEVKRVGEVVARVMRKKKSKKATRDGMVGRAIVVRCCVEREGGVR